MKNARTFWTILCWMSHLFQKRFSEICEKVCSVVLIRYCGKWKSLWWIKCVQNDQTDDDSTQKP